MKIALDPKVKADVLAWFRKELQIVRATGNAAEIRRWDLLIKGLEVDEVDIALVVEKMLDGANHFENPREQSEFLSLISLVMIAGRVAAGSEC